MYFLEYTSTPRVLTRERIEADHDLLALGSSIYEVSTGKPPCVDLATHGILTLYNLQRFPDLLGIDMRAVIRDCWLLPAHSPRDVHRRILEVVLKRS